MILSYTPRPMIHLSQILKRQGERVLYKDGQLQILPNDRIGLVGANGTGKTTIFRIIVGEDQPDQGSVSIASSVVVGYFSQDIADMGGRSALEEVKAGAGRVSELGAELLKLEEEMERLGMDADSDPDAMTKAVERYSEVQAEYQLRGGYDLDARAKEILIGLGVHEYDRPVEFFSGGWKMRIALAGILALNPDVLLMDEPTNHLDLESIVWLEQWINQFKGAILMTSHDREFLNRTVKRIVEISGQSVNHYGGDYDYYERERELRRQQLIASFERQQDMLAKEEEFIARFAARASHAAQVQSRVKKLDKIERIEVPAEARVIKFSFIEPPRSGQEVVRLQNVAKVYQTQEGQDKTVFRGVTGVVQRLNKIAVTGVNGAGKSTLLKIITGDIDASEGTANLGASVRLGYFSQNALDQLNKNNTVMEELTSRLPSWNTGSVRSLLGAFLFSGDDVDKKISRLSGGEKSRVLLASILGSQANFLVLDEPTNHLDLESREVLLSALKQFVGTIMVVSHDRHFLRAIANRVFEVHRGELRTYDGTYDEYLEQLPQ
jgi:ATP-binding cassette subfamily F protein 3